MENIIVLLIIVIIKGVLTNIKTALNIVEVNQRHQKYEENTIQNNKIINVLKRFNEYVMTVNIVSIVIVMISGVVISGKMLDSIEKFILSYGLTGIRQDILSYIIIFILIIIVIFAFIFFSGIIPKRFARYKPEEVILNFSGIIKLLFYILFPIVKFTTFANDIYFKCFGRNLDIDDDTQQEILILLDEGEESGVIDENEKEMINNIFAFDAKIAGDIATHRMDIVAIDKNSSVDEVLEIVMNEKYSRIPVYEDNIDNIVGILHIKDFMKYIINYGKENFDINKVIKNPLCVSFAKKNDELFEEMQKNKIHMSIVIDEYGGTAGIVTMEDLIEEIMGNILDEFDDEEMPEIIQIDEDSFLIDGSTDLEDVADKLDIKLPTDEFDTISGFIVAQIGHIPSIEEHQEIEYCGFIFKIEKSEEKRIKTISVTKKTVENLKE